MPNVFGVNVSNSALIPRMFADPLPVLREECALLRLVAQKNFAAANAKIGDSVMVPISYPLSVSTLTPSMIPPTPG
ncbi:MAG: hypothetical protein N3A66_10895, partial [Planctomycetota bacterium]|nr:hypothetical protein [Planctomycetota bacterium]